MRYALAALALGLGSTALTPVAVAQTESPVQSSLNAESHWADDALELMQTVLARPFMPATFYEFQDFHASLSDDEVLERHLEFVFHDSVMGPDHYPRVVAEMEVFLDESGKILPPRFLELSDIGYETTLYQDYQTGLSRIEDFLALRDFEPDEYARALILKAYFLISLDQHLDAARIVRDIQSFASVHELSELVLFDLTQVQIRASEMHAEPAELISALRREYWLIQDLKLTYTVGATPLIIGQLLSDHGHQDQLNQAAELFMAASEPDQGYAYLRGHALYLCGLSEMGQENHQAALNCLLPAGDLVGRNDRAFVPLVRAIITSALALGETETARTWIDIFRELPTTSQSIRNQFDYTRLYAQLLEMEGAVDEAYETILDFHQTKASVLDDEVQTLAASQMQYLREESDRLSERTNLLTQQNLLQRRAISLFQWLTGLFALLLILTAIFIVFMLRKHRQLMAARDEARRMSEVKSRFLANMSHEVRTPMNGVLGLTGALKNTDLNRRQNELVSLIERSGTLLTKVLDDILDLARIESDTVVIENSEFSPAALFEDVRAFFQASTERPNLELRFTTEIPEELRIIGDGARIRQVLFNLISNALKFTDSGHVKVRMWMCDEMPADATNGKLCLSVEDTGTGIPQDKLSAIFDPFVQVDTSATRRFGGLGLGLAISKQLVELMGGRITAASEIGSGTYIEFSVPTEVATPAAIPLTIGDSAQANASPFRVLVAEDHPVNRKVIQILLGELGLSPDVTSCGSEALNFYNRQTYDFVLLDIQMPDMDGISTMKAMRSIDARQNRAHPQYIAFTANAMTHQVENYLSEGFDGILTKPITISDLVAFLNTAQAA